MNKLLLDTNILLDIAVPSRPESDKALNILGRIDEGSDRGFICASSLKDFYYVMRKYSPEGTARGFVELFMAILETLPVDKGVCRFALDSNEPDFEDGIIRAIAENEGVDFIISRDKDAFSNPRVKSIDPSTYLEMVGEPQGSYSIADL